jgi:DHA1 family tetracycline resistance protein-like MFS transporter
LIVGHFADRLSRIWLYAVALLINAVATVVLVFSRSVSDIVLLRAFGGIGFAFLWPTAEVLVVDLGPKEDRVKEMGTYSVAWGSGFLIGPAVGGVLVRNLGFINLFLISFLLILVGFFQAILGVVPHAKPLRKSAPEKIDVMRQLLPWYVLIACYGMIFSIVTTIFPGYANSVGITAELIGILFATFGISRIAVFATIQHYVSFGEGRVLTLVSFLISVGFLTLAVLPSFFAFLPAMLVLGASFAIIFPISISLISRKFPQERAGAAIGSYESVYGVGAALGPVFAGAIATISTVRESFLVVMLFGFLMAAVATRGTP